VFDSNRFETLSNEVSLTPCRCETLKTREPTAPDTDGQLLLALRAAMLAKHHPCARPPRWRKPLAPAPRAANRLERPIGRNDKALLWKAALQPRLTDTRKKALDAHLQLSIRLRVLLEDAGLAEKRLQLRGGREGGFMWQTADALSAE